jgi:lipoyl(octanoyl) transferase
VREGALVLVEEVAFVAPLPARTQPRLSAEHREHAWLAPQQALELIPFAGLRKALRLALALTGRRPVP